MTPVLYPAAILLAFVANFAIHTEVSPYAAGRPLVAALVVGLGVPWLAGLAVGDRHIAGFAAVLLTLMALTAPSPAVAILSLTALGLVIAQRLLERRRGGAPLTTTRAWPFITTVLNAVGAILLVMVGISAVQDGRAQTIAHDLMAEFPLRTSAVAATREPSLPSMYFILLDGYPRPDVLRSEFGIDASGFTAALRERGFHVASHSRSNYTTTHLTLAQMFNYAPKIDITAGTQGGQRPWRTYINEGAFFSDVHALGYEVVAISPGFEHVALRQADRFIDSGQLNEFEWVLAGMTGVRIVLEAFRPSLFRDMHRDRVLDALAATAAVARKNDPGPRVVFTHLMVPHSPQVFRADGTATSAPGVALLDDDREESATLGYSEYARRLAGQIAFVGSATVSLVDEIAVADPDAVIVVFSDHGSKFADPDDGSHGAHIRTANLLAVRSPGRVGIIHDRSTLANLLPRLLRAYAGVGPADVPETIYARLGPPGADLVFRRPD